MDLDGLVEAVLSMALEGPTEVKEQMGLTMILTTKCSSIWLVEIVLVNLFRWYGGEGGGVLVNGKGPDRGHEGVGEGYGGGGHATFKAKNGLVILWIM